MNDTEHTFNPHPEPTIFAEQDIQDFIEERQVDPGDLIVLEALSRFPKNYFHEYHNFFNLSRERSFDELERQLHATQPEDAERREFLDLLHGFAGKYDWATCWHLVRVFERRGQGAA